MLDQPLYVMQVIDGYRFEGYMMCRIHALYSIPKIHIALKNLLPPIRLLVLPPEVNGVDHNNNSNQHVARQYTVNTRVISRLILRAEDERPSNTANPTKSDHRSGTEGTLPVAADVVGLVSHTGGNTALSRSAD